MECPLAEKRYLLWSHLAAGLSLAYKQGNVRDPSKRKISCSVGPDTWKSQ